MHTIKTPIIPTEQTFVKVKHQPYELDHKAICVFGALGFFLDTDTYWKNQKALAPATINTIDAEGYLVSSQTWFEWHHTPKQISLEKATTAFGVLFEQIVREQTQNKNVILPLSGGLDSRSQAVALKKTNANVKSYSYAFENGYAEATISKKIAKKCSFPFQEFTIKKGYLWDKIEALSSINKCYSEFTHPRQMAVVDEVAKLGNVFSLGHWGDVLFDSENINKELSDKELVVVLKKKIIKKGGLALANSLWEHWCISGDFETYLNKRLLLLLGNINIKNTSAKIRAFKSLYWAPRWTSINLAVFANKHPIQMPYYDDRMCQFICEIPETLLANRQIQIAYIKKNDPALAKVVWQDAKPFHLYNAHLAKTPLALPYRVVNKLKRMLNNTLGKKFVQRNWELQFLGDQNKSKLENYLFSKKMTNVVDKQMIGKYVDLFYKKDGVSYAHSVSTLLTLAMFFKKNNHHAQN